MLGVGLLSGDQMHKVLRSLLVREHFKSRSEGHKVDFVLEPHSLVERMIVKTA